MRLAPPCKINLGLRILRRRPDGYHDLESLFLPVPFLHDDLEIIPLDPSASPAPQLSISGIAIDGDPADNLCMKAYNLLKADFPDLPPVHIRLHKRIPFGAGLGGGSADAAFTLKGLNDLFRLRLTVPRLEAYAARLGADCAFFIQCRPALAEGIGDRLTPLAGDPLAGLHLLLVKPPDAVSTKEAYARVTPSEPSPQHPSIKEILTDSPSAGLSTRDIPWEESARILVNDFEPSVFPAHPAIAQLKAGLLARGACYAAMSGSGSTVFGLFSSRPALLAASAALHAAPHLAASAALHAAPCPPCLLFHE